MQEKKFKKKGLSKNSTKLDACWKTIAIARGGQTALAWGGYLYQSILEYFQMNIKFY